MKKIGSTIKTVIIIVLVAVIGFGVYKFYTLKNSVITEGETTYSNEVLEERITEISKLETLEYVYTNSEKSDEDAIKLYKWDIPFTESFLIVKYDGTIKYSTDLSKAKVNVDGNNVQVTIPKSEISSHEIDEDSWEYLDQKNGLFNRVELSDADDLRKEAKKTMEQRAEDLKLSDQADENAKQQIENLIKAINPEFTVKVTIQE